MTKSIRTVALKVLEDVFDKHVFLQDALEERVYRLFRGGTLTSFQKNEAVYLARGTAERRIEMEGVLKQLLNASSKKMPPVIKLLLITGLFELFYARTPDYAAVNEYVNLAGTYGLSGYKGLINAVLRRAIREKDTLLNALTDAEKISLNPFLFSVLNSHFSKEDVIELGNWFLSPESKEVAVKRLESVVRKEKFLNAFNDAGIRCVESGITGETFFLSGFSDIEALPGYREGWFYFEAPAMASVAAVLRERILSHRGPLLIWDACASPGGKTVAYADLLSLRKQSGISSGRDRILASDISEKKVEAVRKNIERFGFADFTEFTVRDARLIGKEEREAFDLVHLDVPCSGLGVLSGKPEAKWNFSQNELEALLPIQKSILNSGGRAVRKGGILVYSTCTLLPEENENQVRAFLSANSEFVLEEERTFRPGRERTDGLFYAILKKEEVSGD